MSICYISGTLTVEEVYKDRDQFASLVREVLWNLSNISSLSIFTLHSNYIILKILEDNDYLILGRLTRCWKNGNRNPILYNQGCL